MAASVDNDEDDSKRKRRKSMAIGGAVAAALPAAALGQYLVSTAPKARKTIEGATEVSHRAFSKMPRVGDVLLHGMYDDVSPLTTLNSAVATVPVGLPATHAAQVVSGRRALHGGHSLTDPMGGPISDDIAAPVYGRLDARRVVGLDTKFQRVLKRLPEAEQKGAIDAKVKEILAAQDKIRQRAATQRTDMVHRLKVVNAGRAQKTNPSGGSTGSSGLLRSTPLEHVSEVLRTEADRPQMLVRRAGSTFDEAASTLATARGMTVPQLRARMGVTKFLQAVNSRTGRLPSVDELKYIHSQTAIDKLTPYGATGGFIAGVKNLFLPSMPRMGSPQQVKDVGALAPVCDPKTNICSSVPARILQHTGGGGSRAPMDTFPGHFMTDFKTAPVAVTKKDEWLRQLAMAKRSRTIAGIGAIGLAGAAGLGLGYGIHKLRSPKKKTDDEDQ